MHSLTSSKSSGMRVSSPLALTSHFPDALIQRVPPSFIDVFPVLACVSMGSPPIRADSSRSRESSAFWVPEILLLIHSPSSSWQRRTTCLTTPTARLVWTSRASLSLHGAAVSQRGYVLKFPRAKLNAMLTVLMNWD